MPAATQSRNQKLQRAATGLAVLLGLIALVWYLNSAAFQERIRLAMITKLAQITGGRVELREFHASLIKGEMEGSDLTIHGAESAGEPPFVHVDRFLLQFSMFSASGKLNLRSALIEHPVVHLATDVAGRSNRPADSREAGASQQVQALLDVGAGRIEIKSGEVIWNDRRFPLNLTAEDAAIILKRSGIVPHLSGSLEVGKIESTLNGFRPFSSSASAIFELRSHDWFLTSLRLRSGDSRLSATARVTDPRTMTGDAQYELSANMRDLAAITRTRELQTGVLKLKGTASFTPPGFNAVGEAVLTDLGWQGAMRLQRVNAKTPFAIRDHNLTLPHITGNWAGCSFSGNAAVNRWDSFSNAAKTSRRSVTGNFKAAGLRLENLTTALPSSRYAALNLAGVASVESSVSWSGSIHSIRAALRAHIVPPNIPAKGTVPVSGSVAADVSPQQVRLTQVELKTSSSSISATGTLDERESNVALEINSSQVGEIVHVFSALQDWHAPVEVTGSGSFSGRLSGSLRSPSLSGHVDLAGMQAALRSSNLWRTEPLRSWLELAGYDLSRSQAVGWDHLSGDLSFSPQVFAFRNAVLDRKPTHAEFSVEAGLFQYGVAPDSSLSANLMAVGVPVEGAERFLGSQLSLDGRADIQLRVSGRLDDPNGEGRVVVRQGKIEGEDFKALSAQLQLAEHEARFSDVQVNFAQAVLSGAGAYNWVTQAFRLNLDSNTVDLAKVQHLQRAKLSVQGLASLHLDGQGTRTQPRINSNLVVKRLVLNGEQAGDISAQAVTHGSNLYLSLQSNFVRAKLFGSGNISMRGDWPTQFTFNFSRLDIDPLLTSFIAGRVTQHSALDGSLDVHGPLRYPRRLEVEGVLQQARVEVENLAAQTSGPATFDLRDGMLTVGHLHVVGPGTDLVATGQIPIDGPPGATGLNATGQLNLRILQSFEPDLTASGTATASVNVGGSLVQPSITGRLQIANAGVSFSDLTAGLTDVNGSMVFNENRLSIESLTARTGSGQFNVGGSISYSHGLYFNFTAKGSQIRLRYPPGVSSVADADLSFAGSLASSLLSGTITVTRFGVSPQFDFAQYLAARAEPAALKPPDSVLNHIHLDVHLVTSPELQVQMSLARIAGNADLRLRGTVAKPVVLGRVNIVEGEVSFSGTKYRIDRGDITFTNPVTITPVLDIEASAKVRDYEVNLGVHGPLQKLSTTYRSDPPLPTPEIIALIALGRTHQDEVLSNQGQTAANVQSSNALLEQALSASQSSRIQQLFGVSRIKIDPQAGGLENNPNTQLTLEQQVSDRVTLTYLTNLSQQAQQTVQVEVQLSRSLSIVGLRDYNGVLSFAFRLRQRKR